MLVLTRKTGQSIVIDGGIEITVLEVRGEQVRLGIAAPREIRVNRKELLAQIEAAAAAAAAAAQQEGAGAQQEEAGAQQEVAAE